MATPSTPESNELPATPVGAASAPVPEPKDATTTSPDTARPAEGTHTPTPAPAEAPSTWRETIKTLVILLIAFAVLGVVFAVSLGWEIPGLAAEKPHAAKKVEIAPRKVELVKDEKDPTIRTNTLVVPEETRASLGIRKDKVDIVAVASLPIANQTLEFPGSTAFNPAKIARIRVRFPANGSEVVSIGKTLESLAPTRFRELRPGDDVKAGQELATFYSVDVGSKKNDLIDAIWQLKLDQEIYSRALDARSAVPEIFVLNALRSVAGDINNINRAIKNLETWNVPKEDIEATKKEAEELSKHAKEGLRPMPDPEKERLWGQVVLRSPINGVIIERNVTEKEIVVDTTINIFQIANVDDLLVLVNVPEDQLKRLRDLKKRNLLRWTIQTAGAPVKFKVTQKALDKLTQAGVPATVPEKLQTLLNREFATQQLLENELGKALTQEERTEWQKNIVDAAKLGLVGPVDEIGYMIDPFTHTAILKGFIKNEDGALRAGQYVTATIDLPRETNVVEIPMAAIADDGQQQVVFVQPDPAKPNYTMRRVKVTHRFDKTAYVASVLTDDDIAKGLAQARDQGLLPYSPLKEGDRVIVSGLLELKKELDDRQSALTAPKKP